jgi:hypothetical protein
MMSEIEKNREVYQRNDDIQVKNKINDTRTRLLLYVDYECNNYIKNSKVMFNTQLPKEIHKHFSESFTVSFSNPVITSYNRKDIEHMSNKSNGNSNCENSAGLKISSNQSVFDFTKCLIESGKDFIDQRKISVSYKKLDNPNCNLNTNKDLHLIGISSFQSNNLNYKGQSGYTKTSLIQMNSDSIIMSKSKSNLSTGRFKDRLRKISDPLTESKKKKVEQLLINDEEKEARKIQEKFNSLQILARRLKNSESKILSDFVSTNNRDSVNVTRFNGELFDMLEFKGLKFDSKILREIRENKMKENSLCDEREDYNFSNIKEPGKSSYIRENSNKKAHDQITVFSNRYSGLNFKNNLIKRSDNTISNPFSKIGDKVLNDLKPISSKSRRKNKKGPVNHTTKESRKLADIIQKIRLNLFQSNNRNSIDSTHSIEEEKLEGISEMVNSDTNSFNSKNKFQTPFAIKISESRDSQIFDSEERHKKRLNFDYDEEIEKKFIESSQDKASDNEFNTKVSIFQNLYQKKSKLSTYVDNSKPKGESINLYNLISGKHKKSFKNIRDVYNSNISKLSEVSRYSNSIADSVTCSIISKDPSTITRSSISKSENDFE